MLDPFIELLNVKINSNVYYTKLDDLRKRYNCTVYLDSFLGYKTIKMNDLKYWTYLALSYNQIKVIGKNRRFLPQDDPSPMDHSIENLDSLKNLTELYLDNNQIEKIENLDSLKTLRHLVLSYNKIEKLENLDKLTNLKLLSLSYNKIEKLENLDSLKNLTELYLDNNQIEKIENLDSLKNLIHLDLESNQIKVIENLDSLKNLKLLNLSKNYITNKNYKQSGLRIILFPE
jgi:Leucine-rich repeat (LRR) protein